MALLTEKDNVVMNENDGSGDIMDDGFRVSMGIVTEVMRRECGTLVLNLGQSVQVLQIAIIDSYSMTCCVIVLSQLFLQIFDPMVFKQRTTRHYKNTPSFYSCKTHN